MTARFQQDYNGKQSGDPAKAAAAIAYIANLEEPPLRLLQGSDAVNGVEKNDLAKMEADKRWRVLSRSMDFIEKILNKIYYDFPHCIYRGIKLMPLEHPASIINTIYYCRS